MPAIAIEDATFDLGFGHQYHRMKGEALHPLRESLKSLEDIRRTVGEMNFRHQYQQEPMPAEGLFFKRAYINYVDYSTILQEPEYIIQSWDVAAKTGEHNDYSACTTIYVIRGKWYIAEVIRGRWEFGDLIDKVIKHAVQEQPNVVLIEDTSSGSALIQVLKAQTKLHVLAINPKLDKVGRVINAAAEFRSGRAILPIQAPWLFDLQYEMFGFPDAKYDDQVDSMAQGLIYLQGQQVERPISVIPWCGDPISHRFDS